MDHRVYLEVGTKRVFAVSLDWPGWCRSGRSVDEALERLHLYAPRYSLVVARDVTSMGVEIVGSVTGDATTNFGAPRARGPWDETPASAHDRQAKVGILQSCWNYFDQVVTRSPLELIKGPRGGGRTRDQVSDHVREAERAYGPQTGLRIAARTPWPDQRSALADRLVAGYSNEKWPVDFAVRVIAWHVLDHAWEIEDRIA
jgi:hypothetical protein